MTEGKESPGLAARLSWFCLLAATLTPLVFPDVLIKLRMMVFTADDGVHTPQWAYFITLAAAGVGALWVSGGLARVRRSPLAAPLAALAIAAVVLPFFAFRFAAAAWGGLRMLAGAGLAVLAAAWLGDPRRRRSAATLVVLVSAAVAGYGFLQYLGYDPFRWAYGFGGQRVFSTIGNPNFLAGHFAPLVPWAAAMFLAARAPAAQAGWFAVTLLGALLVLVAQTRGAWFAVGAACAWLGYDQATRNREAVAEKRSWLVALAVLGLLAGAAAAINNPDLAVRLTDVIPRDFGQVAKRYAAMKGALLMWRDHPVTGVGPECFKHGFGMHMAEAMPPGEIRQFVRTFSEKDAHCDYLQVVAETGVAGAGIFAWVIVTAVRSLAAHGSPVLRPALLAAGVGLGVHAAANLPMNIAPTMTLFWLGIGMAGAARRREPEAERERAVPARAAAAGALALGAGLLAAMTYVASVHSRAGTIYMGGGDWVNALEHFGRSRSAGWDDRREDFFIASMLFQLGRYDESVRVFEREVARNPYYMDGHANMGSALGIAGNTDAAKAAFRRAIELNPAYAEAYANLGVALLQEKRFSEAAEAFRKALNLEPVFALAQNGLARALEEGKGGR